MTLNCGALYLELMQTLSNAIRERIHYIRWIGAGRPAPAPHCVKRGVLREFARRYSLPILVETGTYQGDMVHAMRRTFKKIISIELSSELASQAQARFQNTKSPKIEILCGDSGKVLPELLPKLDDGVVFWLDGHFSGGITAKAELETPLTDELLQIFKSFQLPHVILVDDARLLGTGDYPSLSQVQKWASGFRPGWKVELQDDILRIFPSDARTS